MKKLHFALLAAALVAPCALFADYAKEFNVKFAGYAGTTTLTNFPALIRLSAARNNFDYTKCKKANGDDVRFFDADDNLLPCEVDTWNPDGESLIWVSVPELNRNTTITVRYGNADAPAVTPTDVWTNGYVGVWHMGAAEGTFTQLDATSNGKNLVSGSNYRTGILCGVNGAVGTAVELGRGGVTTGGFAASDTEGTLDGFEALTLEAWTYRTAYPTDNNRYLFNKQKPGVNRNAYYWQEFKNNGKFAAYVKRTLNGSESDAGVWQSADPGAALNEWTHQVFRWRGDTGGIDGFVNCINVYTLPAGSANRGTMVQVGGSLFVGNQFESGSRVFPGKIDEVRVSNVSRSDDWVVATHDTVVSDEFAVFEVPNDWTQYAHKFSIAFPGVTEDATLENFPVLVKVAEYDQSTGEGIPGFSYADCAKAGGGDLRFTDGNGTMPLPCEVEVWNTNGTSLIWVKVPTLVKGTRITAYYGWNLAPAVNSTEVWDANYLAVWHMNEPEGTFTQLDSTSNGKHLVAGSNYRTGILCGVNGVVGNAVELGRDGVTTGGFAASDTEGDLDGFEALTLEAWTYRTAYPTDNNRYLFNKQKPGVNRNAYYWQEFKNNGKFAAYVKRTLNGSESDAGVWQSADPGAALNEWTHQVFRWRGDTGGIDGFVNCINVYTLPAGSANRGTMVQVGGSLYVGNQFDSGTRVFPGKIDEVRVSNAARSDAWVKATYDTIADNATFTRYGAVGDNTQCTVVLFR